MKKIVVLDGYAMNPGDLSWEGFSRFGELTVYDRTPRDLILERSHQAEVLITNKVPLSEETMSKLPELKYIGVTATGYNIIDTVAAAKRGIVVTNVPAYSTMSVAQMVFALLLELCHHTQAHSDAVHAGEWVANPDFCFWKSRQIELVGKTMGIIGFGSIGKQVAKIASVFGMNVLATTRTPQPLPDIANFEWAETREVLSQADVVTIHAPLTPETDGLINRDTIALMKPSAFLINTSRGALIVDVDVAEALNSGRIAGAGVDVMTTEPPAADNPLLSAKNCLIMPHIAWATFEARSRLMDTIVKNLEAFLSGSPQNVIS